MKISAWKFHVNKSTNGRYVVILGRNPLTTLGLDIRFYENDVSNDDFEYLTDKIVKPEEFFVNPYVDECFESDNAKSSTRRMCGILDMKYERADLNEVMTKQCQKHVTTIEHDILL